MKAGPDAGAPGGGHAHTEARADDDFILRADRVTKRFSIKKNHNDVLADCSVDIRQGEFVSLLGPSGCGKSTLLNMLAGFDLPDSGSVEFMGRQIHGPSPQRVMCFQDALQALLPWRTVVGNVEFALALADVPRSRWPDRTDELLTMVGLDSHRDSIPPQLSGGMRQKLQLARALSVDPAVLLMDEPFGALDAITREVMQRELLRIWAGSGKTVVFVTHDVGEAVLLSDTIYVMSTGPRANIKHRFDVQFSRPRSTTDAALRELTDVVGRSLESAAHA